MVPHTAGLEGEAVLCTALQAQGLPFWREESLREQGYFKTPDVRLQVHGSLQASGSSRFFQNCKFAAGSGSAASETRNVHLWAT